MKTKRIISLLLAAVLACGLLPTTALAATTVNKITMTQPTVGKALPTVAQTSSTGSTHVTNVLWTGATDNGLMRGDTACSAAFTIEIKPDKDAKFTTNTINATVNGGTTGVSVTRVSDTTGIVTYTFPIIRSEDREAELKAKQDEITAREHAEDLAHRCSLAEAEAARSQNNPITIVVNESTLDMERFSRIQPSAYWQGWELQDRGTSITRFLGGVGDKALFTTLDGETVPINEENERRITRVVYDFSLAWYPNETELWLSPQCDIEGILNNIAHDYFGGTATTDNSIPIITPSLSRTAYTPTARRPTSETSSQAAG